MKWRNFNSYLLSHGIKALAGNDAILRTGIDGNSTRYEAGTTDSGIPFFRCSDIVAELEEFVADKAKAGRLTRRVGVTNDALRVTVMLDKGGGYTKAFISVWDVDQGLSLLHAVFMGWYQGQDNHDSVYAVFRDQLQSLEIAAAGINWPYQYTGAAPVTNDESVRAFFNHPAVKRDKEGTCQPALCIYFAADIHLVIPPAQTSDPDRKALFDVPYLSDACERCVGLKEAGVALPTIRTTPYRMIRIPWGGDIVFLHALLGTDSHRAIYPCHICLTPKEKLQTVGVPPTKPPALRSLATATKHLKEFATGPKGTRRERAYSQTKPPILTREFVANISPSPLHVTLGLVKNLVTQLFAEAATLDTRARYRRQWFCEPDLLLQQSALTRELIELYRLEQSLQRDVNELPKQIEAADKENRSLLKQHDALHRIRFANSRKRLVDQMSALTASIRAKKAELKSKSERLSATTHKINSTDGPFTRAIQHRINLFGIAERPYHSGQYVGKDCERIMQHGTTISSAIGRIELIDINGQTEYGGDDAIAQTYGALFGRLYECFKLYSAARPLCSHEIRLLELHSAALVPDWPRTFTLKFHLLTYHMPQFARDWLSIGLSSEQCIESSHPKFNELLRTFAGIIDPVRKVETIGKRFRIQSDPSIASYTPPKRICPKCSLPIARTEFVHCQCSESPDR